LKFQVNSAIDFGSLLIEGIGQAIWPVAPEIPQALVSRTAFCILQATRARITRTEFISCPSCGRTLFDIEHALERVKKATSHLKGLKIAVMGCIVNGPGEMADADYGYVGSAPGKVTLYKGKEVFFKDIPENEAVKRLLELIRQSGDWKEIES
jgi:(E)-4-hydroxy-3-methylbut-2-enyl-diphosphate synthase